MADILIYKDIIIAFIGMFGGVITTFIGVAYKNRGKTAETTEEEKRVKLEYHDVFPKAELLRTHINNTFTLENKGKQEIFKVILSEEISIFIDELKLLAVILDKDEIEDNRQLYGKTVATLDNIINRHHNFYKDCSKYSYDEQAALGITLKKYEMWNQVNIERIMEKLTSVCNSPFYSDTYIKGAAVLDAYLFAIYDIVDGAEQTLNLLNGDLAGLKFRGIVI